MNNSKSSKEQKVIGIIAEIKDNKKLLDLTPDKSIVADAQLSSLELVTFIFRIEEEFDCQIDFENFNYQHLSSIKTFCDFLESTSKIAS
jgi:acyl carrier protein